MDPEHLQRHGPCHKLVYFHRGNPVCRFVRADCVAEVQERLATYKMFRKLTDHWVELSILHGQVGFFSRLTAAKDNPVPGGSRHNSASKKKSQ